MVFLLLFACAETSKLPPVPELPPVMMDNTGHPTSDSLFARVRVLVQNHPDPLVHTDLYNAVEQGMLGVRFSDATGALASIDADPTIVCYGIEPAQEQHLLTLNPMTVADIDSPYGIVNWWAIILHESTHLKQARQRHRKICAMLYKGLTPPELTLEEACAENWGRELEGYSTGCRFANRYGVLREEVYCASVDTAKFPNELLSLFARHMNDEQNRECMPTYTRLAGN